MRRPRATTSATSTGLDVDEHTKLVDDSRVDLQRTAGLHFAESARLAQEAPVRCRRLGTRTTSVRGEGSPPAGRGKRSHLPGSKDGGSAQPVPATLELHPALQGRRPVSDRAESPVRADRSTEVSGPSATTFELRLIVRGSRDSRASLTTAWLGRTPGRRPPSSTWRAANEGRDVRVAPTAVAGTSTGTLGQASRVAGVHRLVARRSACRSPDVKRIVGSPCRGRRLLS